MGIEVLACATLRRNGARFIPAFHHLGFASDCDAVGHGIDEFVVLLMEEASGTLLEFPGNADDKLKSGYAILRTLITLHRCGYCHQDVKPENILLANQIPLL